MRQNWWRKDGSMRQNWWRKDSGEKMAVWGKTGGEKMEAWGRTGGEKMEVWGRTGGEKMEAWGELEKRRTTRLSWKSSRGLMIGRHEQSMNTWCSHCYSRYWVPHLLDWIKVHLLNTSHTILLDLIQPLPLNTPPLTTHRTIPILITPWKNSKGIGELLLNCNNSTTRT